MGGAYAKPQELKSVLFPEYFPRLPAQTGKVIAVTGCTSGTGYVFARTAALKGAHVVMLNRPSARAEAAEAQLKSDAAQAAQEGRITQIACDLQKLEGVRACAAKVRERFGDKGLDCLVNNAGVMALADEATGEGYDVQMQTNHLSHFLLTKELFPLLTRAADARGEARVVNHSSIARFGGNLEAKYFGKNGGNLGGNSSSILFGGARWARYHQSKLANAVFTLALHDRLVEAFGPDPKVKSVCAAPGVSATNLQVTTAADGGFNDGRIMDFFSQSAEDGTLPLLICAMGLEEAGGKASAASPEPVSVRSGELWEPCRMGAMYGPPQQSKLTKEVLHEPSRAMLWAESEKACGEFKVC